MGNKFLDSNPKKLNLDPELYNTSVCLPMGSKDGSSGHDPRNSQVEG
jgi:hypothetical protein